MHFLELFYYPNLPSLCSLCCFYCAHKIVNHSRYIVKISMKALIIACQYNLQIFKGWEKNSNKHGFCFPIRPFTCRVPLALCRPVTSMRPTVTATLPVYAQSCFSCFVKRIRTVTCRWIFSVELWWFGILLITKIIASYSSLWVYGHWKVL